MNNMQCTGETKGTAGASQLTSDGQSETDLHSVEKGAKYTTKCCLITQSV